MPIKNYTSNVDVYTSIGEIQGALARGGASKVMIENTDKRPSGIMFALLTPVGEHAFCLPANIDGVLRAFARERVKADRAQAERTAWRNIRDWVLAQMAFVESGNVEMEEVFLPYLTDGQGRTLYQIYQEHGGQLLLGKGE